jgi:lysylphosphatidylglycerol synthetase-like protein (DUF2156 family)
LLGLGASSALAAFQIDRTLAVVIGLLLLSVGVALNIRQSSRCALRPALRLRAPLLLLAAFGLSYLLLAQMLPALAARQIAAAPLAAPPPVAPGAPLRRVTLSIEKMYCPPCVAHVRHRLAEQAGVAAFVAESSVDVVQIDYRPDEVAATTLAALFPKTYGVALLSDGPLPVR